MSKSEKSKTKKVWKIILIVLIILVLLAGILFLVAKSFINGKFNKMNYETINESNLGVSEQEKSSMSNYRNIAILGIDSFYNDYEDFARSDTIMVASINKNNDNVNLFSIYRDTLVQMDLYGKTRLDKINHAYYGGVETTLKTINTNFDLNITEYVAVDYKAVTKMVDKVGGVEMNITADELKYINGYIKAINQVNGTKDANLTKTGLQTLNGTQATAYARIRYTEGGDYKRAERARDVVQKAFTKLKKMNVMEINSVIDEILPLVKTNIEKNEINELLPKALNLNVNKTFGFPYNVQDTQIDLHDHYKGTKEGVDSYDVPVSLAADVERLHRENFGEDYTASETVKNIEKSIKETIKK